ncbi:MAG: hypothetical protein AAFQ54_08625 [Pseudomonadota bacterium]
MAETPGVAAPAPGIANYDPTLSAKEAVLANWELASAGLRAGRVMAEKVVELAENDAPYPALARQAQFAQKTMVQRYNAAQWVYADPSVAAPTDAERALAGAVGAAFTPCETGDCTAERDALEAAFVHATEELNAAALAARAALTAREDRADTVLMSEQLMLIATYLESGDWGSDFALTDFERDAEEMAARIVGTMSLWRNVEPYVGLAAPEIDAAINAASQDLLRTLRRETRNVGTLAPDSEILVQLTGKAQVLAAEFRRAAALFTA